MNNKFNQQSERTTLSIQWHLTNKCQNHCKHCYMYTENHKTEKSELCLNDVKQIFDSIYKGAKIRNKNIAISFSGGDPLLYDGFIDLLAYIKGKVSIVGILGNSNLIDIKTAYKLKEFGISGYQISLEGTKEINDYLRGEGNFDMTIEAIKILNKVGISSHVMMTISRHNSEYLEDLMETVHNAHVNIFAFARLCSTGEGIKLGGNDFTPIEYRNILYRYLEKHIDLIEKGTQTKFARKDHLFSLLYLDLGLIPGNNEIHQRGCSVGESATILPDGTAYACRRFISPIGDLKKDDYWKVLEGKENLKYTIWEKFEKCSKCQLITICRGCPAVSYGVTGNFYAPDPQCWKQF